MHDDDFDRRLAQRLRAYESRIPDADVPDPHAARRRSRVLPLAAGGMAAVVIGGALGIALLNQPRPVGGPSPTMPAIESPSTSPTPAPSVAPSAPPQVPTLEPATPEPTPGPIGRWVPAGTFGSEGWAEEVADMTYAAGHFIAVGFREPEDVRGQSGPRPGREARIWLSGDGRMWAQLALGETFTGAHLYSVVALVDGSAAIYGTIESADGGEITAAWESTDGRTWTPLALDLPRDEYVLSVTAGPHGLLTAMRTSEPETETVEIWHSIDGATFDVTHIVEAEDGFAPGAYDWEAGPEGFVVAGYRYRFEGETREDRPFILASGDGQTWFEADPELTPPETYALAAPIGGDWIILGNTVDNGNFPGRASTWYSTNGLGWEERASIVVPVPPYDPPEAVGAVVGSLVSTGERVIASGSVSICCHGPTWAAGVWSSFDGRSWERLGFPDGTYVSAAAEHDGVVVLAGFDQAHPADEFRARAMFWIGERD